jgi:voltage-gated potassium channel
MQADTSEPTENPIRRQLRLLYHGHDAYAVRFQIGVVAIDFLILAFFIATPLLRETPAFIWLDYSVAVLLALDMAGRLFGSTDIPRHFLQLTFWLDLFILLTLLFPEELGNLGFLRIMRLWSLSKSGFFWRLMGEYGRGAWRETGHSIVNLITFLFVATGFIYTFFFRNGAGFAGYVDALYFTVATVTTTGFGDITLEGTGGKLVSIVTMFVGITLFVRLAQALFRPHKVFFQCPRCALQRHDPDAVHCKACGHVLKIPDEGG